MAPGNQKPDILAAPYVRSSEIDDEVVNFANGLIITIYNNGIQKVFSSQILTRSKPFEESVCRNDHVCP
jgi:hypothetical protein